MQKHYNYKFNLYNNYDKTWEGRRICKFGNIKSINYLRKKILSKNLKIMVTSR
jgi:hypothetical protein